MNRILLRGAKVITMVRNRPDIERSDILIEKDQIIGIGKQLSEVNAEIIDLENRIIIPGLINSHLHTWQAGLRCIGADWTLLDYLSNLHGKIAKHYKPEDLHIAALYSSLNQINNGVTTLGDWCHNNRTPEHTDAAIAGLVESGIRTVFFHGAPYAATDQIHPIAEIDRIMKSAIYSNNLFKIGMAILGPQYSKAKVAVSDFQSAIERGIIVSMHQSGGEPGEAWETVLNQKLISPNTNIVHGVDISIRWLKILADHGATFSITPENELGQGHGFPITGRLLQIGSAPSLGTDTDAVSPGEILTSARIALAQQRGIDHEKHRTHKGISSPSPTITSKQALEWATVEGARALGLNHVGRIERGMQADLTIIDTRCLNLWPAFEPMAAVLHANSANIEGVMIAGNWKKRNHELVGIDIESIRNQLKQSGDRLFKHATQTGLLTNVKNRIVRKVVHHRLSKQKRQLGQNES
ncbi:amidohydrolase family protein [Leptospira sp. 96542]|nr:amidohydrolase family protein [Leptospira sp. 96542]